MTESKTPWQPISTAPKDGSWILITPRLHWDGSSYSPFNDNVSCVVVRWSTNDWMLGASCACNDHNFNPTHWHPLPEPPK